MSVAGTVGFGGLPVPIGSIIPFITIESFPNSNDGWLLCDGSILAIEDFPDLYDVIGNNYDQATPVDGLFQIPELNIAEESFLTGSLVTNGTKQVPSANFVISGGNPTLTASEIPTLIDNPSILNGAFVTKTGNAIKLTDNGSNEYISPNITTTIATNKCVGSTTPTNTTTLTDDQIFHTNATVQPIPDSQYLITGAVNCQYVSVCYFIKARYFLPPIIPPFVQQIPPNSGIYNTCNSLSGFIGPFPTYSTGF